MDTSVKIHIGPRNTQPLEVVRSQPSRGAKEAALLKITELSGVIKHCPETESRPLASDPLIKQMIVEFQNMRDEASPVVSPIPRSACSFRADKVNEVHNINLCNLSNRREVKMSAMKILTTATDSVDFLVTYNVKPCIAVVAKGMCGDTVVNVGLLHYDAMCNHTPEDLIDKLLLANHTIDGIRLSLVGGYYNVEQEDSLDAEVVKSIARSIGKLGIPFTINADFMNPYKIDRASDNYEEELDFIGYALDVGITRDGCVFIKRNSLLPEQDLGILNALSLFTRHKEVSEVKMKSLLHRCRRNTGFRHKFVGVLTQLCKDNNLGDDPSRAAFVAGMQRFIHAIEGS